MPEPFAGVNAEERSESEEPRLRARLRELEAQVRRLEAELRAERVARLSAEAALEERVARDNAPPLKGMDVNSLLLEAAFARTFQFISVLAPDGTTLQVNRTALEFGGLAEADVVGRPFWEAYWWTINPETQSWLRETLARVAAGEIVRCEVDVLRAGGETATIDFAVSPVRDEAGNVVYIVPEGYDISAYKGTEVALRESETRLQLSLEASGTVLGVFDLATGRTEWSDRFGAILGFPDELVPPDLNTVLSYVHPDDRVPTIETLARAAQSGEPYIVQSRVSPPDGSKRWFETRGRLAPAFLGGQPRLIGTVTDITHQKRAEEAIRSLNAELEQRVFERTSELARAVERLQQLNEALRRSHDLLHVVVTSVKDGLALLDEGGRLILANPALAQIYQRELEELICHSWSTISPGSALFVEQTATEGRQSGGRFRLERADGSALMLDAHCFVVDPAAEQRQILLHLVDMTEQLQLEELAIRNERLATSGRLAAIVAHEVNSPLQAIQNFLFLAATDDPVERDEYLKLTSDEIQRIGGLIRRLHDLHMSADARPRTVELNGLVERILRLTSSILARRDITAVTDLAPELPALEAWPDQLIQVLLNLCLNAVDAMPTGGELHISTRRVLLVPEEGFDPEASYGQLLEVVDNGPGIPPEHLTHIFESFYSTKASGTGLGLSISRQIVEQHGGTISADNLPAGGARFRVILPEQPVL